MTRCVVSLLIGVCAACAAGCQLLAVADSLEESGVELEAAVGRMTEKETDLERLLAACRWEADRNWTVLELKDRSRPRPLRWRLVPPESGEHDPAARPEIADVSSLWSHYGCLWNEPASTDDSEHRPVDVPAETWSELRRLSQHDHAAGWTAAVLLARHAPPPDSSIPLHERILVWQQRLRKPGPAALTGVESAAVETWCQSLSRLGGDAEQNFLIAGILLEHHGLPEEVRGELFRGIARTISPRQIPGLGDVLVRQDSVKLATPLQRAAVEACVLHAWHRAGTDSVPVVDPGQWPDGLWSCRFAGDPLLRKLFGRWTALTQHPDALAVLKSQRLDLDLGVREEAVASLGLLPQAAVRGELLLVMEKGTEPERAAAVSCLARDGTGEILRFVRDEAPRVRRTVALELGRLPSRTAAVTLADFLRDRATDVQLAAVEACMEPAWKDQGRVPLLLHALRVGALRTQIAAVAQLRTEWGAEPIFPLNGTFEERDAVVRKLAAEHGVSTEVYTAFTQEPADPKDGQAATARQDDVRQMIRRYLHPAKDAAVDAVTEDELKSLDSAAVNVIEQEAGQATGPRVDFLYRDLLPRLHPVHAALAGLDSTDPARKREAARELRIQAERASLSVCALRRLSALMLREQDRLVWQEVIAAILPDALPEAARIAATALNSPWPDLRQLGCDYFERHPQPEATVWLLPHLQDDDRALRLRIVRLLGQCGNPAAVNGYDDNHADGLRPLLTSADQLLRWETILAMSALGDAQASQELVRQAYETAPRQREQAVQAMGQTGQSRFVEHLLRRSWIETDRGVQQAILKSLDQLVPMEERPGLAAESSISDKITQWARWWEARSPGASTASSLNPQRR